MQNQYYIRQILKVSKDPGLFLIKVFCHKTTKYDNLVKLIEKYLSNNKKFSQKYKNQRKKIKKLYFEKDLYFDEIYKLLK